jgi:trans-aconitate 2-methyltransferase
VPREWNAADYDRLSAPQTAWGERVLARMHLRGDEQAVDAGCGSGRLTQQLRGRLPRGRVLALDLSHNMLQVARANLAPLPGARVQFVQASLLALPLTGWADILFSTATFHWVLDHPRLFAEIFRALKPGGRLLAQCGATGNLERFHARAMAVAASARFREPFAGWTRPWEFADAATTKARLERAGFADVTTFVENTPTPFDSEEHFAAFITTVVLRAHLARLPDESLRTAFVADVVRACASSADGLVLDYVRLNMAATKLPGSHA